MSTAENPRAVRGDNEAPSAAQLVTERMAADYAAMATATTELLVEAKTMPETVEDESDLQKISGLVVRIRDKAKAADATREKEKEPYLRGGQAVDAFFKGMIERLDKTNTILGKRVNAYQQMKLAEERRRREEEAQEAARIAREAAARLAEQERLADEAELAAARARKPDNIEAHKNDAADHAEMAEAARVSTMLANQAAAEALVASQAKAAAMTRSRFEEGTLVTMKQVPFVEIADTAALDKTALWPFIKDEHLLQALRAWARTTGHKKPMAGATIEMRDEAVIR